MLRYKAMMTSRFFLRVTGLDGTTIHLGREQQRGIRYVGKDALGCRCIALAMSTGHPRGGVL